LAEFVCASARVPGVRVVFETHSPYLLYAVHLEVMKGFPESDVALHWVAQEEDGASRVEVCGMRADGSYDGLWPNDAFSTEYALLAAMERLRQERP
jgi:predicted ATPase